MSKEKMVIEENLEIKLYGPDGKLKDIRTNRKKDRLLIRLLKFLVRELEQRRLERLKKR